MEKVLRVNHSSFVTKEFQNAIYVRSKLKNKMNENPSREMYWHIRNKETYACRYGENL